MTDTRLQELYQQALAARGTAAGGSRGSGARARCPSPEAILALVRREGTEEERLATLDHVMACDACGREFELLRSIEAAGARMAGGAQAPHATPARDRADRAWSSWRRVVPLALAASLLLAVGVGVRERFGAGRGPDVARGDDGAAVALVAPAEGATAAAGAPLTFAWRPDPGARRYVLEMLERGRVVLSDTTADTTVVLRDPARLARLAPGVEYRWWVRAVGDGGAQRASAVRRLRVGSP